MMVVTNEPVGDKVSGLAEDQEAPPGGYVSVVAASIIVGNESGQAITMANSIRAMLDSIPASLFASYLSRKCRTAMMMMMMMMIHQVNEAPQQHAYACCIQQ
jgi:hypothetical protein